MRGRRGACARGRTLLALSRLLPCRVAPTAEGLNDAPPPVVGACANGWRLDTAAVPPPPKHNMF
jgi:hypothetical protein